MTTDSRRQRSGVFVLHAYLLATNKLPSQITLYGITGGSERWLKIPLDLTKPPVTFAAQARAFVRKTPIVPFHGPTTGFIINYSPDTAVRFDASGNPVENLDRAYAPGQVAVFAGKRKLPAGWGFQ
jgi:hypothetical protein